MMSLKRSKILPESELPAVEGLLAEGRGLAERVRVGDCPFLGTYGVRSESEYKRQRMAEGAIMLHAQIGYRTLAKSQRAYAEIYERVAAAGYRVDRYGICLDWSMGYPAARRAGMPRGTGLILEKAEEFAALTQAAPVAPHFGDFVIGTPAALENTVAALAAGATSIGNLGQYFNFRMPRWRDDVMTTAESVKAIALCAAQPVEVLIHSNLDDGLASLFYDLACGIGAVLIERYIVEDLIGARISHCYGHTFSEPITRLAFLRALEQGQKVPGTMVYGNTTIYGAGQVENYANLASYLLVDIVAQNRQATGHALNPVPVSEAMRIPDIDEIVDAHLFANRLVQRAKGFEALFDWQAVHQISERLLEGGQRFKEQVLNGLGDAGIDISNPFELLLAIRRIGAKRLEERFGPGNPHPEQKRKRVPIVRATTVAALEAKGEKLAAGLNLSQRLALHQAEYTICVTCTDVHEYGKILLEAVLTHLNLEVVDAGVSADPDVVAKRAKTSHADFIAISTYNGVALHYIRDLHHEMKQLNLELPIFIGGKLNQIPDDSPSNLPVDVSEQLQTLGVIVCHQVEDMLKALVQLAHKQRQPIIRHAGVARDLISNLL